MAALRPEAVAALRLFGFALDRRPREGTDGPGARAMARLTSSRVASTVREWRRPAQILGYSEVNTFARFFISMAGCRLPSGRTESLHERVYHWRSRRCV